MYIFLKAIGAILLVDFITGFVHWLEDSYWAPETPLIGKWLIVPNLEHHQNGQAFLQKSWWESSWDLFLIGTIIIVTALLLHQLNWALCIFALLIMNANQIHKWSHMSD